VSIRFGTAEIQKQASDLEHCPIRRRSEGLSAPGSVASREPYVRVVTIAQHRKRQNGMMGSEVLLQCFGESMMLSDQKTLLIVDDDAPLRLALCDLFGSRLGREDRPGSPAG
jgi:hypothetical protein